MELTTLGSSAGAKPKKGKASPYAKLFVASEIRHIFAGLFMWLQMLNTYHYDRHPSIETI